MNAYKTNKYTRLLIGTAKNLSKVLNFILEISKFKDQANATIRQKMTKGQNLRHSFEPCNITKDQIKRPRLM